MEVRDAMREIDAMIERLALLSKELNVNLHLDSYTDGYQKAEYDFFPDEKPYKEIISHMRGRVIYREFMDFNKEPGKMMRRIADSEAEAILKKWQAGEDA